MTQSGGVRQWLILGFFVVIVTVGVYGLLQRRVVEIPLPPPSDVVGAIPAVIATTAVNIHLPVATRTPVATPTRPVLEPYVGETAPAPDEVKAIYATAYTALSPLRLTVLIDLIKTTELNAIVINVKDGERTFLDRRMAAAVQQLRAAGIYPIARLVVFQDNELARRNPAVALRRADGSLWSSPSASLRAGNGYYWVDPVSRVVWDENVRIAEAALAMGFAEINLDYIRFPGDGKLEQIVYPESNFASTSKTTVIREFLDYFTETIKEAYPEAVISADVFGYSFLTDTDLGIGQRIVDLAEAVDVIAPMIYPSHFSPNTFGYPNPAAEPYEVVRRSLEAGLGRLLAEGLDVTVRPWLQDFNLGAIYDAAAVREEIRAVGDAGLTAGWMIWSPQNTYDREQFMPAE